MALGILSRRPKSLNIAVSDVYIPWWNRAGEIVVCGQIYLCSVWCVIYFHVCVLKLLKTQSLVLCYTVENSPKSEYVPKIFMRLIN